MRAGRRAAAVAVCGLALVALAAVLTEAALRSHTPSLRDEGFPEGLFVADAARGYTFAPGTRVRVQRVHPFEIAVNEAGYRDRPWTGAGESPRLLLVGSSALFGFGVAAGERLGEQLERRRAGVRTFNAGVYGYGPPQARATIERECARLAPRLVLYVHEYKMTRRDFLLDPGRGVAGGQLVNLPSGAAQAGSAAPSPAPAAQAEEPMWRLPRLRAWLWHRGWHPTQLVEGVLGRERLSTAYVSRRYLATQGPEFPAEGPRRAAEQIRRMQEAAQRCGARFAMVLLPGPYEHRYAEEPASAALKALVAGDLDVIDLRRALAARPMLMLPGVDYFDAPALAGLAAALDAALREGGLLP